MILTKQVNPMKLSIQKLFQHAVLPQYATPGSAAMDLCACLDAPLVLPAAGTGESYCQMVPTGLAMAIPEGYVGLIFARSGLASKHAVAPANCVGVIDSDYRGEVKVALANHGREPYTVQPGDRIAQLMIAPVVQPPVVETAQLPQTQRGEGGFGSTGR